MLFEKLCAFDEKFQFAAAGKSKASTRDPEQGRHPAKTGRASAFAKAMLAAAILSVIAICLIGMLGGVREDPAFGASVWWLTAMLGMLLAVLSWRLLATLARRVAKAKDAPNIANAFGMLGAFSDGLSDREVVMCFGMSAVLAGLCWFALACSGYAIELVLINL